MGVKKRKNQPLVIDNVIQEKLQETVNQGIASRITRAIQTAYDMARKEALQDAAGFAEDTFSTLLYRYLIRQLYTLSSLPRDRLKVRVARNASRTNFFLYMQIGDIKLTIAKTKGPLSQPRNTVYRRLLQQTGVIELLDSPDEIKPTAQDIHALIHVGHSLKSGIPYGPDFIQLSAFSKDGKTYVANLDLAAVATGKTQRNPATMDILLPLPSMPIAATLEPVEQFVKPKRKRGEPKRKDATEASKEKKTS